MKAILQVADTGPVESLIYMFNAIGIECLIPSENLLSVFRRLDLSTIISRKTLEESWGYSPVNMPYKSAELANLYDPDTILVDVKGHVNYKTLVRAFPKLTNRILWYRINGGEPERVAVNGDEINPPCPVITPNQWYTTLPNQERTYTFWPKLIPNRHSIPSNAIIKKVESEISASRYKPYLPPMTLVHNLQGWGFAPLVPHLLPLGIKLYGIHNKDGVIANSEATHRLSKSIAMVHLKSSDAPGYALYEAIQNKCPLIVSRRLIWRNKMEELLIPHITCLVFDRETHEALTPNDITSCTEDITHNIQSLTNTLTREEITNEAKNIFDQLQWSAKRESDVSSLRDFIGRNFPS